MRNILIFITIILFKVGNAQTDKGDIDPTINKELRQTIKGSWTLKKINHIDKSNFVLICPLQLDRKTLENKTTDSVFNKVEIRFTANKLFVDHYSPDNKRQRFITKYNFNQLNRNPECSQLVTISHDLCKIDNCVLDYLNGYIYFNYYFPDNWLVIVSSDRKTAYSFERKK